MEGKGDASISKQLYASAADERKQRITDVLEGFFYLTWIVTIGCAVCEVAVHWHLTDSAIVIEAAHDTPIIFVFSLSASALIVFDRFKEARTTAMNRLTSFTIKMEKDLGTLKAEMVREFSLQARKGVRFMDVREEYQLDALFGDAVRIYGYFPVHTILKDNLEMRKILVEAMKRREFLEYKMIVGKTGALRMHDIAREIGNEYSNDVKEIKKKMIIYEDTSMDELKDLRMSFFVVDTVNEDKSRVVIYVWEKPFGYGFQTVNNALVIEGINADVKLLFAQFAEKLASLIAEGRMPVDYFSPLTSAVKPST